MDIDKPLTADMLSANNVDMIVPTRRGAPFVIPLLEKAANNVDWIRHTFIIVFDFDTEDDLNKVKSWYRRAKKEMPMPWITLVMAEPESRGNVAALRHQGIQNGQNTFIYFQDDDDPLPRGIEKRINYMNETGFDAVYGVTETTTSRGQLIERFPPLDTGGNYIFDPILGSKIFPTYLHPACALFKRSLLEAHPYYDGTVYHISDAGAYLQRILFADAKVAALPDVVRRAVQHEDNGSEPIMPEHQRKLLVEDIRNWRKFVTSEEIAEFQDDLIDMLTNGEVTTFKEIDAWIEDQMESGRITG